jgi:hypothetical protein
MSIDVHILAHGIQPGRQGISTTIGQSIGGKIGEMLKDVWLPGASYQGSYQRIPKVSALIVLAESGAQGRSAQRSAQGIHAAPVGNTGHRHQGGGKSSS